LPTQPSDPEARDWELECLARTRDRLAHSRLLLPNRSFHTIDLVGSAEETLILVRYTDVDGITETTRRFLLWQNPQYRQRDGSLWDPGSVAKAIEYSILER
jgi:hypothetical protein